jgi:hypothetical protein
MITSWPREALGQSVCERMDVGFGDSVLGSLAQTGLTRRSFPPGGFRVARDTPRTAIFWSLAEGPAFFYPEQARWWGTR